MLYLQCSVHTFAMMNSIFSPTPKDELSQQYLHYYVSTELVPMIIGIVNAIVKVVLNGYCHLE